MADPISLGIGALAGALGGIFGSKSSSTAAPAAPAADQPLPPDPSTPAIAPGSKPAQKNSQQQSFLSGAAALQKGGAASVGTGGASGGKSLLGQ